MNFANVRPRTVALLVAGVIAAALGTYLSSGWFQIFGALLLASGLALAFMQARRNA